jgi:hypothetical protein
MELLLFPFLTAVILFIFQIHTSLTKGCFACYKFRKIGSHNLASLSISRVFQKYFTSYGYYKYQIYFITAVLGIDYSLKNKKNDINV